MNVDSGGQVGQEDIKSLTARVDTMSEMFAKIMGQMTDTNTKMDAIMMSLGPQGPLALEMGAIKEQMKQSDENNEVRFKKLEETVYKNKNKEDRFDETANKVGGPNRRAREEPGRRRCRHGGCQWSWLFERWGVPGKCEGYSKSWGAGPRRGSSAPNRPNRGDSGSSGG